MQGGLHSDSTNLLSRTGTVYVVFVTQDRDSVHCKTFPQGLINKKEVVLEFC
jgi:hypothetical protein